MADEPTPPTPPTPPTSTPPPPTPTPPARDEPDDVEAMRAALKKANKEAADTRAKLKEIEDRDKSDADKLTERASASEQRAAAAESQLLKLQVGAAKGLTIKQAARLVGTTQEELEADAEELLTTFASNGTPTPTPPGKPREHLKPGGGDPDLPAEETDLSKLAERMFRK